MYAVLVSIDKPKGFLSKRRMEPFMSAVRRWDVSEMLSRKKRRRGGMSFIAPLNVFMRLERFIDALPNDVRVQLIKLDDGEVEFFSRSVKGPRRSVGDLTRVQAMAINKCRRIRPASEMCRSGSDEYDAIKRVVHRLDIA